MGGVAGPGQTWSCPCVVIRSTVDRLVMKADVRRGHKIGRRHAGPGASHCPPHVLDAGDVIVCQGMGGAEECVRD